MPTIPASSNDPLFIIPRSTNLVPLTDSVARKHLKNASIALNISPSLTFHAFRRAGASWAFSHGVLLEHIMRHGTWKSDAIWTYLFTSTTGVWVSFIQKFHNNIKFQRIICFHHIFASKSWFAFMYCYTPPPRKGLPLNLHKNLRLWKSIIQVAFWA